MVNGRRRGISAGAGVMAGVLLLLSSLSCWLRFDVVPADALGRHVRSVVAEPAVRDELARRLAAAVAASDRRLTGAEAALRAAADIVVGSRQFADLLDIAVQQIGRAVLSGREEDATRLVDIEQQLVTVVEAVDPGLASRLPRGWDTSLVDLRSDGPLARWLRVGRTLASMWWLLVPATVAAWMVSVLTARRRDRAVAASALGLVAVGAAMILARGVAVGRVAAVGPTPGARAALRSAAETVTGTWQAVAVAYVLVGLIVAVAVLAGAKVTAAANRLLSLLGPLVRVPRRRATRLLWALAAVAAAVALAVTARRIGPFVVLVLAAAMAFAGVRVAAAVLRTGTEREPAPGGWRVRVGVFTAAVLTVGAFAAVRGIVRGDEPVPVAGADLLCNGRAELCDRRLDEVTFAGTHNSMAALDDGFLSPSQRSSLAAQLDGGIRALLVDTKYGLPTDAGVVWTDLRGETRAGLVAELGEETVASIEQLRTTLVPTSSTPEPYLCHNLCELGAVRAVDGFAVLRRYLELNPSDVVLLVIQDDTDAADTVAALRAAGLDRYAYTHPPGEAWPTLGTMIRSATPLVVLAERHGGEPAWLHPAFEVVQDTNFTAITPDELDCERNRGRPDAPLFLLNHWLAVRPPEPRLAEVVNAEGFLYERAQRCMGERGRRVNIIAVDFWQTGDLLAVVDRLNREHPPPPG
ncbi:MAG: hypothetical protein AB7O92_21630 [Acidimicrobiia bacterium]